MWANHPEIARRWAHKYPHQKNLPMYKNTKTEKKTEKKAIFDALYASFGKFSPSQPCFIRGKNQLKKADSDLAAVNIAHADKPTYAGEAPNELKEKPEEKVLKTDAEIEKSPVVTSNDDVKNLEMKKLSVVLSQAVRQAMSKGQYAPRNVGLPNRPMPTAPAPVNPMPVGAQPQQAQPQQAQNPNANNPFSTANADTPVWRKYGPVAADGNLNGNAAFGVKNSPDSSKTAASISSILDTNKRVEEGKKVENVKPKVQATGNKADLNPNDATNKTQEQKQAGVPKSWGGQRWQLGESGINPRIGYKYMLGTVPTPDLALRVGMPGVGVGVGLHPWPYIFVDDGQPSGRHGNNPRSLWKYMADGGRSPEDAFFLELSRIQDNAPIPEYEKFLRSRGVGRSSEEIQMLAKILSESTDVKRNAMAKRLPMAVNSVLKHYDPKNPKSLFMNKQSSIALDIYYKAAARGDATMKAEKKYNSGAGDHSGPPIDRSRFPARNYAAKEHTPEHFRGPDAVYGRDQQDAGVSQTAKRTKELRSRLKTSVALDIYYKAAARGDMLKKHLHYSGTVGDRDATQPIPPRSWPNYSRRAAKELAQYRKDKQDGKLDDAYESAPVREANRKSREAEKRLGFRL